MQELHWANTAQGSSHDLYWTYVEICVMRIFWSLALKAKRVNRSCLGFLVPSIAVTSMLTLSSAPLQAQYYVEPLECTMTNDRAMLAAMGCPTLVAPRPDGRPVPVRESVECAIIGNDRMMRAAMGCPAVY